MQLLQHESKEINEQPSSVTRDTKMGPMPQYKMGKFYPPKPKINAFNALFTCYLCRGYMINPTTIDVCTHTYCRSCIARHLAVDCCCPQCGKTISMSNLISDDILRSIIFKLVPGLYQKERERLVQFVNNNKEEGKLIGATEQSLRELLDTDDQLFSPADPISLSLEFHPVLVEKCSEGSVPPVRYLQCPASVKIQHLKRFLYSKFEMNPFNRRLGIDIIYEDEILPSDFTLMDVAYCYKWQRHAPLKLTYRILIYNNDLSVKFDSDCIAEDKPSGKANKAVLENPVAASLNKMVSCTAEKTSIEEIAPADTITLYQTTKIKSSKLSSVKHSSSDVRPVNQEVPVKVTISRKPSENKKTVSKKSSILDEFVMPTTTNDFKSLRSNDIRFSDYAITSPTANTINALGKSSTHTSRKEKSLALKDEKSSKCDIVVSIPHNQMQEEWETKPLSHLKTASKKSTNPTCTEVANTTPATKKNRNVPKLKIELNSLKTKLIEKPKSADIRLDTLLVKHHRPRKFSLDEPQPVADKIDLETYVKNIGLRPIEIQTANKTENTDKCAANASPMSSCSSTTSSSTSNFNFNCSADITSSTSSSSSHKKRKKKHSKDSRPSKDSKRKKMHAEISSHPAEESLKMKVKLTPPINIKSVKLESKKHSPFSIDKVSSPLEIGKCKLFSSKSVEDRPHDKLKEKLKFGSSEMKKVKAADIKFISDAKQEKQFEKVIPLEIETNLGDPSSKTLPREFEDDEDLIIPDSTSLGLSKSLVSVKDTKLPQSPPLPPSLFKTAPLTFSTFSPNVPAVAKPKPVAMPKDYRDNKPKTLHMKPIAPKPIAARLGQQSTISTVSSFKTPHFAVPNPPRFISSNQTKFLSTPTSIASSANKQMGSLLKRSISLDDSKNSGPSNKHQRIEKPNQITVSAYGSNLHITKVEIPATPTSSMAKTTYEIPLYSPLSASYNPKCSFSVNATTSTAKSTKAASDNQTGSSATPAKHIFTANTVASNKTDVDIKKTTTNDIKSSSGTTVKTIANTNNKTSIPTNTSVATLMGPPLPLPMQKLSSSLTASVPAAVKSPPPSLNTVLPFASTSTLNSTSATQHTPVFNTAYLSSPLSMVNYRQSKVLLAHVTPTNLPELKISKTPSSGALSTVSTTSPGLVAVTVTGTTAGAVTGTTTGTATAISTTTTMAKATTKTSVFSPNGLTIEKSKSSLRQFRLPSRESGQDILDLSASPKTAVNGIAEMQSPKPSKNVSHSANNHITTSAGSSLEMALNKIKQNMTSTTTSSATISNSKTLDNATKKQELPSPISEDLQNLHLLSESATAREKIAISTSASATSASSYLYDKAKITQNSLVRQQNASVRNIPNPSALAFRNQQPATAIPPMVTIAAGLATFTDKEKPLLLKTLSPPKSPHSTNCSTSSNSPSRITTKKHPSIDQVAASLNQRASAAAEASAKAILKQTDETSLVSSTSFPLTDKLENKEIKQETTEMQCEKDIGQPSSTMNSSPPVNVLDIKKEPEEKIEEPSEIKPSAFINATAKKPAMLKNLMSSEINATTPPSALLTATMTAGL